jgi:hypothetical protein
MRSPLLSFGLLAHRYALPAGPNRSVFIIAGSCPSAARSAATSSIAVSFVYQTIRD